MKMNVQIWIHRRKRSRRLSDSHVRHMYPQVAARVVSVVIDDIYRLFPCGAFLHNVYTSKIYLLFGRLCEKTEKDNIIVLCLMRCEFHENRNGDEVKKFGMRETFGDSELHCATYSIIVLCRCV